MTNALRFDRAFVVLALLALGWWALVNLPPATIGTHALEKHGEDVMYGWNDYQRGDCTEVWRSVERNRVIRVVGQGMVRFGIVTTLGGKAVTAYPAPAAYWAVRTMGYEMIGREGDCR